VAWVQVATAVLRSKAVTGKHTGDGKAGVVKRIRGTKTGLDARFLFDDVSHIWCDVEWCEYDGCAVMV
jgi:hypothetical protein